MFLFLFFQKSQKKLSSHWFYFISFEISGYVQHFIFQVRMLPPLATTWLAFYHTAWAADNWEMHSKGKEAQMKWKMMQQVWSRILKDGGVRVQLQQQQQHKDTVCNNANMEPNIQSHTPSEVWGFFYTTWKIIKICRTWWYRNVTTRGILASKAPARRWELLIWASDNHQSIIHRMKKEL